MPQPSSVTAIVAPVRNAIDDGGAVGLSRWMTVPAVRIRA